jgi:SAM-dependent methyltransferase
VIHGEAILNPVSRVIGKVIGLTNVHARDVLAVSSSRALACAMTFSDADITETTYPDVDICALPYKNGAFDMVVSDQVLEHVREPREAVAESVRVTRSGGLIVHTTCCVNPIHGRPDHWRFTPNGLTLLVPDDAKLLEVGGWGNPLVWLVVALGAQFVPVPVVSDMVAGEGMLEILSLY